MRRVRGNLTPNPFPWGRGTIALGGGIGLVGMTEFGALFGGWGCGFSLGENVDLLWEAVSTGQKVCYLRWHYRLLRLL